MQGAELVLQVVDSPFERLAPDLLVGQQTLDASQRLEDCMVLLLETLEPPVDLVEVAQNLAEAFLDAMLESIHTVLEAVEAEHEHVDTLREPLDATVERVDTLREPLDAMVERVDSLPKSADAFLEPVEALVEPVKALVEPVKALVEPVEPLVEPVKALAEPVEPPIDRGEAVVEEGGELLVFAVAHSLLTTGGRRAVQVSQMRYRERRLTGP